MIRKDEHIVGKVFSGHDMMEATFINCVLENCDFSEARLDQSSFRHCRVTDCNFDRATMYDLDASGAEFIRCNFRRAVLAESKLTTATFTDCKFHNTLGDGERIWTVAADPNFYVVWVDESVWLGCTQVSQDRLSSVTCEALSRVDPKAEEIWRKGRDIILSINELRNQR